MDNEKFEQQKNNYIYLCEKAMKEIKEYQEKKEQFEKEDPEKNFRKIEVCQNVIKSKKTELQHYQSFLQYMRLDTPEDLEERDKALYEFPEIIKSIIPDSEPFVFHGTANVATVMEIIKSGGLKTPEERVGDYKSFASQIDVTYKNNISVTCDFADKNRSNFMPYGAIFVFKPKPSEIENVLNTGNSSEVHGGVDGVDFIENPDRLVGIITTTENKIRIQQCCEANGWDTKKVFTHEEFILKCKKMFSLEEEASLKR